MCVIRCFRILWLMIMFMGVVECLIVWWVVVVRVSRMVFFVMCGLMGIVCGLGMISCLVVVLNNLVVFLK